MLLRYAHNGLLDFGQCESLTEAFSQIIHLEALSASSLLRYSRKHNDRESIKYYTLLCVLFRKVIEGKDYFQSLEEYKAYSFEFLNKGETDSVDESSLLHFNNQIKRDYEIATSILELHEDADKVMRKYFKYSVR